MTTRYVGAGGNDGNSGLTWALRKLTLNGVEDTPVVAGDFVWVGAGNYRELLTVDVAGTAGNPITYAGDFTGVNTDGVGGIVRITGSDGDTSATRAQCINMASGKHYRTFQGFVMDSVTGAVVNLQASCTNLIVQDCLMESGHSTAAAILMTGTGTNHIVRRCRVWAKGICLQVIHSSAVDNSGIAIENCIFTSGPSASGITVRVDRVGGITLKNCIVSGVYGVRVQTALTVGQTVTVTNSHIVYCNTGLASTTATELAEDYNAFHGNATDRTTTNAGANSLAAPPHYDPRWFMQLVFAGAGPNNAFQIASPFDLSSYSQLRGLAGTSPPTLDIRGTAVQSSVREWGPLEYDTTLKTKGDRLRPRYQIGM